MIYLKLLSPFLALISGILHLGLASKWRDRRTKKHQRILNFTIIIMVLAFIPTAVTIYDEDIKSKKYQNELKITRKELTATKEKVYDIDNKLAPFISLAQKKYPNMSEKNALDELRAELYNPKARIMAFLDRITSAKGMSDSDAIKLISLTKQLITFNGEELEYPIALFYCDWILSTGISDSSTSYFMLSKITDVFLSDDGINKVNIPIEVSRLISIKKFRNQLLKQYVSEGLSTTLFDNIDNWKGFMNLILKEIVGKVIEFPSDIESRNNYAGKIYKEMKDKATSHEVRMARKLWLSDNVDNKPKGDVWWYVETKPRVMISGRLYMLERKEDFSNNN